MREAHPELRGALIAASILAGVEILLVLGGGWDLFLTSVERFRYAFAAMAAWPLVLLFADASVVVARRVSERASEPERALTRFCGVATASVTAVTLWLSTEGRRAREASWRVLAVVGGTLLVAGIAVALVRWLIRRRLTGWGVPVGLLTAASAVMAADTFVFPRLYGAFHTFLTLGAIALGAAAARQVPFAPARLLGRAARFGLVCGVLGLAAFALVSLAQAPNARFATEARAPLTGKLVAAVRSFEPAPVDESAPPLDESTTVEVAGIDLRGVDVLLITVDALRADVLASYGGAGTDTPAMDQLASEGMVFARAYTPTPHTSYALTSLLTGKFLRPVLDLPQGGAPAAHPAMPELLREYGYRTAAFYPPAIFFVDAERFRDLAAGGFGFEYRKTMFAPAAARVAQLERYLAEVEPGHPVFAWVHLFEPHEPYDPPEEYRRGEDSFDRYRGEVAAADAAVGDLVRAFREARPGGTVILTADHGEEFGDHGGYHHGTTLFDEQVRVPLIWSSPDLVVPSRVDAPVEIIDIATTLLAALGIPRDARMRGDDLGPLLAGHAEPRPAAAFSEIDDARMVTDGRYKAICPRRGECRLFDLQNDPAEREDLDEPERLAALRSLLAAFVGSIPRIEAMALGDDAGWPEALARASLGDPTASDELVPLLGDERAAVRREAARSLGVLGHQPARAALSRLGEEDPDPTVRAEAALAALSLGSLDAVAAVEVEARSRESQDGWARRAALTLAEHDVFVLEPLLALVADDAAPERSRREAAKALGLSGDPRAREVLIAHLDQVNIRGEVAEALGQLGGRSAADALALSLANERYIAARTDEARALVRMRDPRAPQLIRRFLGMDRPIPGGVDLLVESGALHPATGLGASVTDERVREGMWDCNPQGCLPGGDAAITLPATAAPATGVAVFSVESPEAAVLRIDGVAYELLGGRAQVRVPVGEALARRFAMQGPVRIAAVAVVPAQAEIPPPPPEPWEAEDVEPQSQAPEDAR